MKIIIILSSNAATCRCDGHLGNIRRHGEGWKWIAAIAPNDFDAALNYSYEEIDLHALNAPSSAKAQCKAWLPT